MILRIDVYTIPCQKWWPIKFDQCRLTVGTGLTYTPISSTIICLIPYHFKPRVTQKTVQLQTLGWIYILS